MWNVKLPTAMYVYPPLVRYLFIGTHRYSFNFIAVLPVYFSHLAMITSQ